MSEEREHRGKAKAAGHHKSIPMLEAGRDRSGRDNVELDLTRRNCDTKCCLKSLKILGAIYYIAIDNYTQLIMGVLHEGLGCGDINSAPCGWPQNSAGRTDQARWLSIERLTTYTHTMARPYIIGELFSNQSSNLNTVSAAIVREWSGLGQ